MQMFPVRVVFVEYKICTKCYTSQPVSNYWKQSKASDGLNTWCKRCISLGMRNHARARKLEAIVQLGNQCNICKQQVHPAAYDFHHTNIQEKEIGISKLLQSYKVTHPRVQKELSKCILVCSNCHRELHAIQEDSNVV